MMPSLVAFLRCDRVSDSLGNDLFRRRGCGHRGAEHGVPAPGDAGVHVHPGGRIRVRVEARGVRMGLNPKAWRRNVEGKRGGTTLRGDVAPSRISFTGLLHAVPPRAPSTRSLP